MGVHPPGVLPSVYLLIYTYIFMLVFVVYRFGRSLFCSRASSAFQEYSPPVEVEATRLGPIVYLIEKILSS